jgi:hypothetical protein
VLELKILQQIAPSLIRLEYVNKVDHENTWRMLDNEGIDLEIFSEWDLMIELESDVEIVK